MSTTTTITSARLDARLSDPEDDLTVVDVRPTSAYSGWPADPSLPGGHIPGAVSFPAGWLATVDAPEIERELRTKGIVPRRDIVLYGTELSGGADASAVAAVAARLEELGLGPILTLEGGVTRWLAEGRPVERLPRYEKLVDVDWLSGLLAGGRPVAAPAGDHLLFHVNFGVPEEYEEDHLPGALYLDTNCLEDPADWNRRSPERARRGAPRPRHHGTRRR